MPALLAYALHGGVGKAVVGLASVATPTAYRGEGHKVVQLRTGFPGCPVKVQGAIVLGLVDILEEFWSLVLQHGIPQNHGQVEDTSNRPKLRGFSDESTGPLQ